LNEAIPFCRVEPLHRAFSHFRLQFSQHKIFPSSAINSPGGVARRLD
jgi:hypothetical protein